MLLPNKLYSYNESTLSKFPVVLKELRKEPLSVHELYRRVIKKTVLLRRQIPLSLIRQRKSRDRSLF